VGNRETLTVHVGDGSGTDFVKTPLFKHPAFLSRLNWYVDNYCVFEHRLATDRVYALFRHLRIGQKAIRHYIKYL